MTKDKNVNIASNAPLATRAMFHWLLFCSAPAILAVCTTTASAKDKSSQYQQGTYITASLAADGTTTNNITCGDGGIGGTVCSGGVNVNTVTIYRVKVDDGVWSLETYQQATDATMRRLINEEPFHFKKEKENPLDFLKNGDKVLFRVERHKKIGSTEIDIFIPFADKPDKEAKFVGTFVPFVPSSRPARPARPTDNVQAMCNAHKLSPELEKKFCSSPGGASTNATQ